MKSRLSSRGLFGESEVLGGRLLGGRLTLRDKDEETIASEQSFAASNMLQSVLPASDLLGLRLVEEVRRTLGLLEQAAEFREMLDPDEQLAAETTPDNAVKIGVGVE